MATAPTLITDPSKINPAGAEESDLQEYQKSLESQISALEQRYAQPNWFKVAAGFAKPQLGGFTASLGSAADALGENIEKQRESQLPIAQMRTQLAQSKIAMGQNQKAADLLASHKGPVDDELVKELMRIAPDAPSTKAAAAQLKTSMDTQAQARQVLHDQYESGAITKAQWANELAQLKQNTSLKNPSLENVHQAQMHTMPNGVVLNDEQYKLQQLGVPIISGVRDKEKQAELYANRATNPNPVAPPGTSQHELGNAIDVDTKNLTPEQRGMLRAMGYSQPMPNKDPNHWQKSEPEKPSATYESLGATGSAANELTKTQLEKLNANYAPIEQKIMQFDPQSTSAAHVRHNRLAELLATPGVQKGTGLLYKDQGILSAITSSLSEGAHASISTPGGGAGFNLSFPVENAMTKTQLKPEEQKQLREFQMLLRDEASDDLRKGVASIGGGHLNQAEFSSVMNQIATGSDPFGILKGLVGTRSLENEKNEKLYEVYGDWINSPQNAGKPISIFFHSKPYKDLIKSYEPKLMKAKRLAD